MSHCLSRLWGQRLNTIKYSWSLVNVVKNVSWVIYYSISLNKTSQIDLWQITLPPGSPVKTAVIWVSIHGGWLTRLSQPWSSCVSMDTLEDSRGFRRSCPSHDYPRQPISVLEGSLLTRLQMTHRCSHLLCYLLSNSARRLWLVQYRTCYWSFWGACDW